MRTAGLIGWLDRRYDRRPQSVAGHLRTLLAIHDVDDMVRLDTPWWTYRSIRAVDEHLRSLGGRARVFEYGAGASSLWLAARSHEVHAVEHDAHFAGVMRETLNRSASGAKVTLLEVRPPASTTPVAASRRRGEARWDYGEYVGAIDVVGGAFDLVVIDGRARVACLEASLAHLAPGAIIVFDDAQRPRYRAGIRGSELPVQRIWGMVPSLPYPRQTALLGPVPG
jgi:hypothetical protein